MLSFSQKLMQTQKLSPQQIQYQKLLQLNTMALEQRIKAEIEMNPLLEEQMLDEVELTQDQAETEPAETSDDEFDSAADDYEIEDYMNEGDLDEDRINYSPDEDDKGKPLAPQRVSLSEKLMEQLHVMDEPEELIILGEMIIQSLDEDGYFTQSLESLVEDLDLFDHIKISMEDAERILHKIQTFEPIGIACRDLQECLLVQLKNSHFDPYYSFLAEKILTDHYDEFANKRFEIIEKKLNLTNETLKKTFDIIYKLNPKPGEGNIQVEESNQITPDFTIEKIDDNYIVTLNDRSLPSVTINQTYLEMLNTNKRKRKINPRQKDAHKFLREKFESAKWFIASINQRRHTLLSIMRAILEKQYEFFEIGPKALKPMIYKDIADEIQMDISTISRVVNGKYVQSPVGIHELKYFFSEGLSTDSGSEISNKHIKEIIKDIVSSESKKSPYSDDKIAALLNEKGINIARRTVAKYRESMMIPVARLRKEI
ncbi:RNA polymerase sigma-54 factor RpoN [hydrothermal vent metagenome]|uniref:RNA polymerase sigma-54 factor RpoN n=1 Tax=hydrothermal vent metagenome TaxID=652676 RepID=A0A3B1CSV4_9ZZZZ